MPDTPGPTIDPTAQGSIVVSGTGSVAVSPDVADLRLGVTIARPTVDDARGEASSVMEAILAAIARAGVASRDIRTSMLSLQPRYDYRDGTAPILAGYELSNVVEVTVRDLARVGDVVDGTLKAGATSMDSLSFRVADPAPAEREARVAAMGVAKLRADVLAAAAGLTIVGVRDIVEGTAALPPDPRFKSDRMLMASDASTPVEPGTTEIRVTVTVAYRTR